MGIDGTDDTLAVFFLKYCMRKFSHRFCNFYFFWGGDLLFEIGCIFVCCFDLFGGVADCQVVVIAAVLVPSGVDFIDC